MNVNVMHFYIYVKKHAPFTTTYHPAAAMPILLSISLHLDWGKSQRSWYRGECYEGIPSQHPIGSHLTDVSPGPSPTQFKATSRHSGAALTLRVPSH